MGIKQNVDKSFMAKLRKGEDSEVEFVRELLFTKVNRFVQDRDIAEDITQKIWERMHKKKWRDFKLEAGRGNGTANFRAWADKVALNAFKDYRRWRIRELTPEELASALGLGKADIELLGKNYDSLDQMLSAKVYQREPLRDNPLWKIDADKVREVITEIPDRKKRMAFVLKFGYGFTIEETARILRRNKDSVQTDIYRTQKKVRDALIKRGITASHLDPDLWNEKNIAARRQGR